MTTITHPGDPYAVERAIDRALEGQGWRVVVMHSEAGGAIRIAPVDGSLFGDDVVVLKPGEQLHIGDDGLTVVRIPAGSASFRATEA